MTHSAKTDEKEETGSGGPTEGDSTSGPPDRPDGSIRAGDRPGGGG